VSVVRRLSGLVPPEARARVKPAVRAAARASSPLRPPPDFLIVGAKRGGTTSLWNWLLQHKGVLPMVPGLQKLKSSHYFYMHYGRGHSWYRGFFPLASTRRLVGARHHLTPVAGEASPYYLFDPRVPARVAAELPDVRVIVLLRDPVDRAYSHWRERVQEGVEPLGFRDALAAEPDRLAGELERMASDPLYYSEPHDWYSYRSRGIYAPQLQRWKSVVAPDRLLVVPSEDLYADPQAAYTRVTSFLGLPASPLSRARRHNHQPFDPMPDDVRADLAAFYRGHDAELTEVLGHAPHWPHQ
jgi:hypothetical protein